MHLDPASAKAGAKPSCLARSTTVMLQIPKLISASRNSLGASSQYSMKQMFTEGPRTQRRAQTGKVLCPCAWWLLRSRSF